MPEIGRERSRGLSLHITEAELRRMVSVLFHAQNSEKGRRVYYREQGVGDNMPKIDGAHATSLKSEYGTLLAKLLEPLGGKKPRGW